MPAATKFYISRCTSSSLYEILKYWMPQLYCIWCVIACWRCIPVKFQPLHDLSLTSWCLDQNSSNFPYICFILCDFVSATRMYSAKLGEILSDVTFLAFVIKFWKFVDVISKVCKWHKQWGYFEPCWLLCSWGVVVAAFAKSRAKLHQWCRVIDVIYAAFSSNIGVL